MERDEVFLELTRSICPVCKWVVDAEVNIRENKVVLRKRCPEHGPFEALVYSDAELYLAQLRFNKPGTLPLELQTETRDGCPLDCGLCPEHKQHTCLAVIEVNTACNLDCPIRFADSGHQPDGYALTLEQVDYVLDSFVAAVGEPEVVARASSRAADLPRRSPRALMEMRWRVSRVGRACRRLEAPTPDLLGYVGGRTFEDDPRARPAARPRPPRRGRTRRRGLERSRRTRAKGGPE